MGRKVENYWASNPDARIPKYSGKTFQQQYLSKLYKFGETELVDASEIEEMFPRIPTGHILRYGLQNFKKI
jgi:hypothetical protein